jgi:hypothetical protein
VLEVIGTEAVGVTKRYLMACGCVAEAVDAKTGKPCCVTHLGRHPGAETVVPDPDLTSRFAKCDYCGKTRPSSLDLPFFEYRPSKPHDVYYCGCRGWED